MRAAAIGFVIALALAPSAAFAQAAAPGGPPPSGPGGPPPGGGAPPPPGAFTRDQFIQQRAEQAGQVFDRIDTDHKGYITRAQLRAFMRARRGGGPPPGPAGPPSQQ
jgi:hypothetical protein